MNRRGLAVGAAAVLAVGAIVIVGHTVWHASTPAPAPKLIAPLCPTPGPFVAGQTYTLTGCQTVPPGGFSIPSGVTINGGAFLDSNNKQCPYPRCAPGTNRGRPAFTVRGSGATLENLSITGANVGGYHDKLAFNAGVELEGSAGTTISNVHVGHVFGDCLNLEPLRGAASSIISTVTGLTVTAFSGSACGRNGLTCASVNGATFTGLTIGSNGQDPIDCEADQTHGEGAKNLTITGGAWNGLFAVNAGGESTGPITVTGLVMSVSGSGDMLQVKNRDGSKPAGAITFAGSTLRCTASQYVGCLQLDGATVVMSKDTMQIGYPGARRTAVYHATDGTTLTFTGTTVAGDFKAGTHDATSTVTNPIGIELGGNS